MKLQVSMTIEPELWERVKVRASAENRSASNLVEGLLTEAMDEAGIPTYRRAFAEGDEGAEAT